MKKLRRTKKLLVYTLCISCLLSTCLLFGLSFEVFAKSADIPLPQVKKDVYVYDENNIIDDAVEDRINTLLVELEKATSAEIAVITVDDLLGMEIEDYSYELANTLGIGKKDKDNGVLLLISKPDKRVRLEIGNGLEGCLNDSKCGRILDDYFVPYREEDKYSEGTEKTIEAIVSVVAKEYGITIEDVDQAIADEIELKVEEDNKKAMRLLIIIIVIIIILVICDVSFFDGVILSALLRGDSSSGGSSGGGFGGGGFSGGGATR